MLFLVHSKNILDVLRVAAEISLMAFDVHSQNVTQANYVIYQKLYIQDNVMRTGIKNKIKFKKKKPFPWEYAQRSEDL